MKSYLNILLIVFPAVLLGCQPEPWRNPRERFETFSKHLSKGEMSQAMVFVDPEDRKVFEKNFDEIPEAFKDELTVLSVGSMKSPRLIRRIEVKFPRSRPEPGSKLELTLHYLNDDKKNAYLVWRDQWYVDLIR